MIKWPITYTDYDGVEHTEDFYFNLNKAEIMEMDLKANGAYAKYLQRIVDEQDGRALAEEFKRLILGSYGKKSDDGRRFVKSQEIRDEFEQSEAYSELFMQLATDAATCEKFIQGVMPKVDGGAPVPENMRLNG